MERNEENEENEENQDIGDEEDEGERAQKRRRIDERIPRFSRETLEEMMVQNLKKLCIQWNIKGGKNKATYVENISQRSQTIHEKSSSVDKVYCSITSSAPPDPAPAHQVYQKWFNFVDKANKKCSGGAPWTSRLEGNDIVCVEVWNVECLGLL